MCTKRTLTKIFTLLVLCSPLLVVAAPSTHKSSALESKQDFDTLLDTFLDNYYENITRNNADNGDSKRKGKSEDIYDQMQGDQPVEDTGTVDSQNGSNKNGTDDVVNSRDKLRKDNWIEYIKSQILSHLRRNNTGTFTKPPEDPQLTDFNITKIIPQILNTTIDDDQITEKIRSFYPSCDSTQTPEPEQSRDSDDIMYLNFDFDFNENRNSNIASAILRIYRLPQNLTINTDTPKDDCKPSETLEEEKLLRVSVYWFTKPHKKRRVKKRMSENKMLSDSKMLSENARWVELSVKPATKAWNKAGSKNLKLGILVEDQESRTLRADKIFKGASCTVGVSTPKPIPTIIRDTSLRQADELDRIHSLLGRNSTSTIHSDSLLLPTVDICYLELPENINISQINPARINACNLRKVHEENQMLAQRERLERLATLHFSSRHIRHQRQHRQSKLPNDEVANLKAEDVGKSESGGRKMTELESNLRSSISNKQIVITREELERLQRGLSR